MVKHDDNFHKYISHDMDSLKRGQANMVQKIDQILGLRDEVKKNTSDIGWMKKIEFLIIGALGIFKFTK